MKTNKVDKYIHECLRLLYLIYFKPYTLRRRLKDIYWKLKIDTNPFDFRSKFTQVPQLYHYANQFWLLTIFSPFLAILVIAPIYSLFSIQPFRFISSGLYTIGWIVGVSIGFSYYERWKIWLKILASSLFLFPVFIEIIFPVLFGSQKELVQETLCQVPIQISSISQFYERLKEVTSGILIGLLYFGIKDLKDILPLGGIGGLSIGVIMCVTVGFGKTLGTIDVAQGIVIGSLFGIMIGIIDTTFLGATTSKILSVTIPTVLAGFTGIGVGLDRGLAVGVAVSIAISITSFMAILRFHLWIPELIWMLRLQSLANQDRALSALCYLPPYFDQLIILPLPFMAKIIIKSYRQNPIAARSTIDYFITSTNQQKVAKQAMFGIGVETLNQCRYVSDIICSQVQLDWLPTDEKTFGKVLPRLLEISHNIDIAYKATTAHNRLELVDRSISDLQKLQTSLSTAASASDAPLFGTITMRWLQILQDNRQALETAAQASAEIPNPYLAGSSLEPADAKERFKGRQDLFREIEKISLSTQPPVLLLYGRRRTGKTSTLKYLPSRVSSDLIPLLVDFQGAASIQRVENIARFMAEAMTKTAKSSRNLILPKISPEQLSSDPFYALQTWMEQIEQVAPHKRFLLCIDEFERLEEVISTSGSRAPLNFLRYVTQNCRQWIVLFSGSHRLEELEPYWSDYLIGTRTLSITYLQEAEARELIQHPVPTFPDIYSPAAVDAILSLTRGQPYLVQLLCSCIVEYINSAEVQRKLITASDVEAAKPIAWERGAAYLKEFSDALTPAQRDFIHRLLAHSTYQENDLMVIRQLIQSEIIEKDVNDEYRFQVPLIEQYIREKSIP